MITEILSTGDEVLLGDVVDTNAAWLCRQLKDSGLLVSRVTAVGDDAGTLVPVLTSIALRADVCIMTGGLGPTQDDLTALAVARAAQVDLEMNPEAYRTMAAYFKRRAWVLGPENEKQAMLPRGARVLENRHGTAPGFEMALGRCRFYCLPGVPSEMMQMFGQQVKPRLFNMTGETVLVRRLTVFGLPESEVGHRLEQFAGRYPGIRLGFRANFPLIEVKLVATVSMGKDTGQEAGMESAVKWVTGQLGHRVVSFEGLTLEQEVGRLLTLSGQTLGVAESCTGGLISHLITEVPGASNYFLFSAITYANSAKVKILKVSQETLDRVGAVHEETARQMAAGVREASGADWAVATTGIAGPAGGTAEKPVGTVCIGVAGPGQVQARRFVLDTGDRERNKQLFAATALEMLRRQLAPDPSEPA